MTMPSTFGILIHLLFETTLLCGDYLPQFIDGRLQLEELK